MKMKAYSIYDGKMEAYLQPIFCRANGEAMRMFAAAINEQGHQFNKHAEDYTLMAIGEWDDQKGELVNYTANVGLGNALEYLNVPERKTWENIDKIAGAAPQGELQRKGNGAVQGGE